MRRKKNIFCCILSLMVILGGIMAHAATSSATVAVGSNVSVHGFVDAVDLAIVPDKVTYQTALLGSDADAASVDYVFYYTNKNGKETQCDKGTLSYRKKW